MQKNTYFVVYNAPKRYVITVSGSNGFCVVSYILTRVEINQSPSGLSASYILIGNASTYVVDRYYSVNQVTCETYPPPEPYLGGSYIVTTTYTPPPRCDVRAETSQEPSSGSGGGSGGGGSGGSGGSGGGAVGVVRVRFVVICPGR
ncbi:MAG: hypothetical protein QXH12_03100 [Candidatus Caldarchaeum sp.]